MRALIEAKREYESKDPQDRAKYRGIQFQFTSHFPIPSILPLRVKLANPNDCDKLYVWVVKPRALHSVQDLFVTQRQGPEMLGSELRYWT